MRESRRGKEEIKSPHKIISKNPGPVKVESEVSVEDAHFTPADPGLDFLKADQESV